MSENMIHITAILMVKPEAFGTLEAELRECADLSQKEAACLRYEVGADIKQVGRFVISEIWKDEAGFQNHLTMKHFQKLEAVLTRLSGTLDVIQTSPFSTISQ